MNQKGFTPLAIILIIVGILVVVGGSYYAIKKFQKPTVQVCTQEAKQCPDGSYVSRTGLKCEFEACPTTQSVEQIKNSIITINEEDYGTVQFINGSYHFRFFEGKGGGEPNTDGYLRINKIVAGNINNGYDNSVAVIFYETLDGNGVYEKLGVITTSNGTNKLVDWIDLGDRIDIKSFTIDNGNIVIERSIEDSCTATCPSGQYKIVAYKVENGKLQETTNPNITDQTTGWKTYSGAGFEIQYPENTFTVVQFTKQLPPDYKSYGGTKLISSARVSKLGKPECSYGETGFGQSSFSPSYGISVCKAELESGVEFVQVNASAQSLTSSLNNYNSPKTTVTLAGKQTVRWSVGSEGDIEDYYYIPLNSNQTLIVAQLYRDGDFPQQTLLNQVLATLVIK